LNCARSVLLIRFMVFSVSKSLKKFFTHSKQIDINRQTGSK